MAKIWMSESVTEGHPDKVADLISEKSSNYQLRKCKFSNEIIFKQNFIKKISDFYEENTYGLNFSN